MDVRRDVSLFATIHSYVDGLFHQSVQQDALTSSWHWACIAPRTGDERPEHRMTKSA